MPMPQEYFQASRDFERYMADLKSISLLATHHQCYAMTRAVLHVFRSHLPVVDALVFADVLPPVLRAIFVEDWDASQPVTPFSDRETLTREVRTVRANHNISPESAIADVAAAVRKNIDPQDWQIALDRLAADARSFWEI
ncbi:DUF2267 domain-containing protein [Rhizobium sp. NRK18]|uniref:DUF2267 domain-containing protein n=1 Tax=Rhizobium sp. NRK18 TaxID=2964667 RepID=UPI0021C3A49B|nr:DUF2267 domain-containing protein [Rhizobium sp. NRK18]MCQ2002705.1 DUF2267 domain-containing protein [Rhizobium sp. NRK18]